MKSFALILVLAAGPVFADEISDGLEDALKAYQDGDLKEATELVDYVKSLLGEKNANLLTGFLPDAPEGWSREVEDTAAMSGAFAGLGQGGLIVSARYTTQTGKGISYMIMADSPMMAMMGAIFSNPALMGGKAKVKRINRQKVLIGEDGQLQAMVHNRFIIQMDPDDKDVTIEEMIQLFEATDIDGLKDF